MKTPEGKDRIFAGFMIVLLAISAVGAFLDPSCHRGTDYAHSRWNSLR